MEKLEETLKEISVKKPEIKSNYEGLKLVEDKNYQGGTSIMYWM